MISKIDLNWLKINYPGIYFVPSKDTFQGCLWFKMNYSFSSGEGLINPPNENAIENSLTIEDAYELTIKIDYLLKKVLVWEVGGRILGTKSKWRLSYSDVHMYRDGSLCLCPEPEEKLMFYENFSISFFFYNYLIPDMYYQTYLNRFGREPWKSSSHGEIGILENYFNKTFSGVPQDIVISSYIESLSSDLVNLLTSHKKIDQNIMCICGSGKIFRDCHLAGFNGLKKLRADYLSGKTIKASK